MPTVSVVGIDAAWAPSRGPSTVTDADGATERDSTGFLAVPEVDMETSIVILDLAPRTSDTSASHGPPANGAACYVSDKPLIGAPGGGVWARLQAAGFPCLVAVLAQPVLRESDDAPPWKLTPRALEEGSDDKEYVDSSGQSTGVKASLTHATAHPLPPPRTTDSLLSPVSPSGASDTTAKPLLVYLPTVAPAADASTNAAAAAGHDDMAGGIGDADSEVSAVAVLPSLLHSMSSHGMVDKQCRLLNPDLARAATATTTAAGRAISVLSSIAPCRPSQPRALLPLYFASAPVASLRYLLALAAMRADNRGTQSAPRGGAGATDEVANRRQLLQVDAAQQPLPPSPSACTDASTGAVGVARVVCRAVWPIPPWPPNPPPEFAPEAAPLLSYSMSTDGDHHGTSIDKSAILREAGTAAPEEKNMEAVVSDVLVHLGEWNSSLVAGIFMSAKVLAVSKPTTQASQPPLPQQQREGTTTTTTSEREAEADATTLDKKADSVTVASSCPTAMPELLAVLFQYWHQRLASLPASSSAVRPSQRQQQHREAPASHKPVAVTTTTAAAAALAALHHYTSASLVEQLLMSIEFSIAYLANRKQDAAAAVAMAGGQADAGAAVGETLDGDGAPTPPLTSLQVQRRLQCYRLPPISSHMPFEAVWGLYLGQRIRMFGDSAAAQSQSWRPLKSPLAHATVDLADRAEERQLQDACGLSCTAMHVWTLWQRAATGTTTTPSPTVPTASAPRVEVAAVETTPLSSPLQPPLQPHPANPLMEVCNPPVSRPPPFSPYRVDILSPSSIERRCPSPDRQLALPPVRCSTPQPPPSRLPTHISFTVQTVSKPCKSSCSAPDVAVIEAASAAAAHGRPLPSPHTPFAARGAQVQQGSESVPVPSATMAAAATAELLQVLPSFLPSSGPVSDTPSPLSPKLLNGMRNASSAQWLHKRVRDSTATAAESCAAMPPAQQKAKATAWLLERRDTRGFRDAAAASAAENAPASQYPASGTMQGSRIDSWESIGSSSLDSTDEVKDRGNGTARAAGQGTVRTAISGSVHGSTYTTGTIGAAPSEEWKETLPLDEEHWLENRGCIGAATTATQTPRHRRPRGGVYSAASFVAALSTAVTQLLSEQQEPSQQQQQLHNSPIALPSFAPSASVYSSSITAAIAAQRLERIRRGRLLPSLAKLDSLNLLPQYVPVWCYTYDPITSQRITTQHGDDDGGSSAHVHNQSYLQRYPPSSNGVVSGSRGGNAGGGIHDLSRAGKAGLTATYRYVTDTARTVLDAVKLSVPNMMQCAMGSGGGGSQPASGGTGGKPRAGLPITTATATATDVTPTASPTAVSVPRTTLTVPLPVTTGAYASAYGSGNATRDVAKNPSLYYAVCGLYITEQDIIIRALPTVEVQRQRERMRRQQRSGGSGRDDLSRNGVPPGSSEAERSKYTDGNNSLDDDDDDDSESSAEEVVELLILPRVSLVSVTPCAVNRSVGGVFATKHARKLYDHLEEQPNLIPSSAAAVTSGLTSAVPASGSGGAAGSRAPSTSRAHRVLPTNATTLRTGTNAQQKQQQQHHPCVPAHLGQPEQSSLTTPSTVVVLKLQSAEMRTVWLEFANETVLNEVHRLLCTPLRSSTQLSGMPASPSRSRRTPPTPQRPPCYGNRFLSSARRLWSMVPLVLLATNVLPPGGATSPFMQAFLKNVTVAAVMLHAQAAEPGPAAATTTPPSLLSMEASTLSLPPPPPSHGCPIALANTWWLYDPAREFVRQGLPEEHWCLTSANMEYTFCPTYPSTFVVPAALARAMENGEVDGRHRMSRRVEAVAFYYAPTGGVLVRSAQPTLAALVAEVPTGPALEWTSRMTGGRIGRAAPTGSSSLPMQPSPLAVSLRDAPRLTLNAFAAAAGVTTQQICVMDLRSAKAAFGNVGKGGGSMELLLYPFGGVEYAGLPNIHSVQRAWRRLRASLTHDAPYQLRGNESGCLETQYVQYAGEPPYAAVVAAAELPATAKRPASGLSVTPPLLASLLPRLQGRSPSTRQQARDSTGGTEVAAALKTTLSASDNGDGNRESVGPGGSVATEETADTATATSSPSRLPFSLRGVRWSAIFSAMTTVGGASVTAMMPAAQHEWLTYVAMLLNTAVVAARRVCGVPTDPLYVPAMQHNGLSANCFSYIVGHAFTQFRLPKAASLSSSSATATGSGSRRGFRTPAVAAARAARSFKASLASYEHSAHETFAGVVFLNCSDGWDRTPQISILTQLLLDPYYRTVEGLCILLEREVLCFGHPTQLRSTAIGGNVDDYWDQLRRDDRDSAAAKRVSAQPPAATAAQTQAMETHQRNTVTAAFPSQPILAAHSSAADEMRAAAESERRSGCVGSQVSCSVSPSTPTVAAVRDDDDDSDATSAPLFDEESVEVDEVVGADGLRERALHRWLQKARVALSGGSGAGDVAAMEDASQSRGASAAAVHASSAYASMSAKPPIVSLLPSLWSRSEAAPILTQLLDAIHQLVVLYPVCFEYTPQFVCLLLDLLHSGLISTFSVNCEQQVEAQRVAEGSMSLSQWCALLLSTTTATPSAVSTAASVTAKLASHKDTSTTRSEDGAGASTVLPPRRVFNRRAPATPGVVRQQLPRSTSTTEAALPSFGADPTSEAGVAEASVGSTACVDASFHRLTSATLMGDAGLEVEEKQQQQQQQGRGLGKPAMGSRRCSCSEAEERQPFAVHRRSVSNEGTSGSAEAGSQQRQRTVAAQSPSNTGTSAPLPLGREGKIGEEETVAMDCRSSTPLPASARPDLLRNLYFFDYTTRWGVPVESAASPLPRSGHALSSSFSISSSATSTSEHPARPHDEASLSAGGWHTQQHAGCRSSDATAVDEFSRRLLPISYDALYTSGYLNPNFSLRHNRVDVGPLVDFILPSRLTLWRAAYTRHSFWGVRQAQLQHAVGQYPQQRRQHAVNSRSGRGVSDATDNARSTVGRYGGGSSSPLGMGGAHMGAEVQRSRLWSPRASSTGAAVSSVPITSPTSEDARGQPPSSTFFASTSVTSRGGGGGNAAFFARDGDGENRSQGRPGPFRDAAVHYPVTSLTPGIFQFHIGSDSEEDEEIARQ
nr:unnamed protein product [Leishmania braziliensis]